MNLSAVNTVLESGLTRLYARLKKGEIIRAQIRSEASDFVGNVTTVSELDHLLHLLPRTPEYAITQEDRILRKYLIIHVYQQLIERRPESKGQYMMNIGKLLGSKPMPDFGSAGGYLDEARQLGVYDSQSMELIAISHLTRGDEAACLEVYKTYFRTHPLESQFLRSYIRLLKVIDCFDDQLGVLLVELENETEPKHVLECIGAQFIIESDCAPDTGELRRRVESSSSCGLAKAMLLEEQGLFEKAIREAKPLRKDIFLETFAADLIQRCKTKESIAAGKKKRRISKTGTVALLLSGFLRDYLYCRNIQEFLSLNDRYRIDIFISLFDRMGDIYLPEGVPQRYFDYQHGGFYRETSKTRRINQDLIVRLFDPVRWELEERKPDDYYLDHIGMEHPQWLKVYDSFLLMEKYEQEIGQRYDIVVRGRFDLSFRNTALHQFDFGKRVVFAPRNHVFGPPGYMICDRFAVGNRDVMETYCGIGRGKTFVELESDDEWQDTLLRKFKPMHEAHLAYWLKKNGIAIETPENLFI